MVAGTIGNPPLASSPNRPQPEVEQSSERPMPVAGVGTSLGGLESFESSVPSQVALITGASAGLGAALAEAYAERGYALILCARRIERLKDLSERLGKQYACPCLAESCDVSKDGDVEAVVERALKTFGRLDVVIANAGFGVVGPLAELSLNDYRRQMETNVFGVLRTVKAALPALTASRGRLAILGSVSSYACLPATSAYSMSKAAITALAASLYHELKPAGIHVSLITPGFVESEIRRVDNSGHYHPGQDPVPAWLRVKADVAARQIVRAIAAKKREAVITAHGKAIVFLARHASPLVHALIGWRRVRGRPEPSNVEA